MVDFSVDFSPLGKLGQVYDQAATKAKREQILSSIPADGNPQSLAALGVKLMQAGDTEGGMAFSRLAEAQSRDARDFGFRQQETTRAQSNADRTHDLHVKQLDAKPPNILAQTEQRKQAATTMGLTPDSPAYQSFVLTGKMPREDAQPLTATDKKAILEADEGVLAAKTAIEALNKAKQLSPEAMGNPIARRLAPIGAFLGNETSEKTVELDNVVTSNALSQLKAIFGGAPTEGERKILLDIQGSSGMPDVVRQKVFDRAIQMAEARLKFNEQRANEMRGGSFYKAPKAPGAASQPGAPAAEAVAAAKSNPQGTLAEARAAIAGGKDPKAVAERLRGLGIDPRWLDAPNTGFASPGARE
jgi:hypothetical protein